MSTSQTVLQGQDTVIQAGLYMSFELGDNKWMLTLSDGRRGSSRYSAVAEFRVVRRDRRQQLIEHLPLFNGFEPHVAMQAERQRPMPARPPSDRALA